MAMIIYGIICRFVDLEVSRLGNGLNAQVVEWEYSRFQRIFP